MIQSTDKILNCKKAPFIKSFCIWLHQDLSTGGKRAVRPPPVERSAGSEAIWRKSKMKYKSDFMSTNLSLNPKIDKENKYLQQNIL